MEIKLGIYKIFVILSSHLMKNENVFGDMTMFG